ncbi:MAG: gamma-glutamyltransferase [Phenylobacterium sp.]|uniref:gamma-glutamyltransferase family protein n=1 Tax=Phenylobacterium sp. TaxID=1871053 RepID=UPI0025E4F592|nr:gamma-glutamyltransferase [Phenylobacterium sp.]MCA3673237.1 gamma-glutamyltransferase [Methylobacterium sp.]MCA6236052.1 gamma-glutamyltransferase [Phenylobacterium sp.]MCA6248911.1 gamma-glutamyltransferase [Phenylobacterium sp.]MCA6263495.1 gamma-glutamyltransferase [Phenylobacterium sp.]MCA6266400.1 gamma-glutamyltransferase [Phenylobacterium sp.]
MRSRQVVVREEVVVRNGAVAASRRSEADAGVDCLREGGSAVDAAVCAAFVACVVEPFSTSIGGCGFMLVHDPESGRCVSIEFPTRAPLAARADMYRVTGDAPGAGLGTMAVAGNANSFRGLAVGVPGLVAGLIEAHRRFGRLPLSRVVQPAADVARKGFKSDIVYDSLAAAFRPFLASSPKTASALLVRGEVPVWLYEQRIVQAELGDAIEQIGRDGGESFHRGDMARAIVNDVAEAGGLLTLEDLGRYRPIVGSPRVGRYRTIDVATPTSPSGAWTVLQALAILERFDLGKFGRNHPERVRLVVCALRHAFADRYAHLGDDEVERVPLDGIFAPAYLDAIAEAIASAERDDRLYTEREPWAAYLDEPPLHDPWPHSALECPPGPIVRSEGARNGTVHVTAADRDGMLVSCTHTVGDAFGAKFVAGPGVVMNAGMQWFCPHPGSPNSIAPWKRPLANMAPAIVYRDDRPVLGVGAYGGRRIISAVTQIISDVVDHGLTPQQACEAPRVDASEKTTFVADALGPSVAETLRTCGHRIETVREDHTLLSVAFANATAICLDADGAIRCGVDAIRPCEAVGF